MCVALCGGGGEESLKDCKLDHAELDCSPNAFSSSCFVTGTVTATSHTIMLIRIVSLVLRNYMRHRSSYGRIRITDSCIGDRVLVISSALTSYDLIP